MRKFASAILLSVVVSGTSFAQTKTYEVKGGDTFDAIAQKFHVTHAQLLQANKIGNSHKLKLGQKLVIPRAVPQTSKSRSSTVSSGQYKVRNGDHDWAIAARFGVAPIRIRQMNPGVNWDRLQIGQVVRVPVSRKAAASVVAKSGSSTKRAATARTASKWGMPTSAYCVKKGDNDWTIAHRFGIGLAKFQALNPTIKTGKLIPGQYVRVPGSKGVVAAVSNQIRSRYAVISKDSVVVRRGASTTSEKVTVVERGTNVSVLDRQNGWYKLRFPRGTVGWVRGDMLKAMSSAVMASNLGSKSKSSSYSSRPSTRVASVRSSPRAATRIASTRSKAPNANYVYKDNGAGNSDIVANAMGMLGTRYRYGSANRGATDCSGMVMQAAARAGIKLPRTSSQMSRSGSAVAKGNLKPGDLVFFNTRGSRISHVGIYKGGGQFVHASSGKGHVTVSSLNDGYYSRRYAGARRVGSSSKSKAKPAAKTASETRANAPKAVDKPANEPVEKPATKNPDEISP